MNQKYLKISVRNVARHHGNQPSKLNFPKELPNADTCSPLKVEKPPRNQLTNGVGILDF
jgi:hypothetical protein